MRIAMKHLPDWIVQDIRKSQDEIDKDGFFCTFIAKEDEYFFSGRDVFEVDGKKYIITEFHFDDDGTGVIMKRRF